MRKSEGRNPKAERRPKPKSEKPRLMAFAPAVSEVWDGEDAIPTIRNHRAFPKLRRRAGKNRTALNKANSAANVIPTSRSGSDMSQTRGKRINASNAKGQHNTSKMHQATNRISAFIPTFISPFPAEMSRS
jgi:hypothetical protein